MESDGGDEDVWGQLPLTSVNLISDMLWDAKAKPGDSIVMFACFLPAARRTADVLEMKGVRM